MEKDPEELLEKYNAGLCSEEEKAIVESWYLKLGSTDANDHDIASALRTRRNVWSALTANKQVAKSFRFKYRAVAAILLVGGAVGFFYLKPEKTPSVAVSHPKQTEIIPGGNKAFLTLNDGRKISLTDAARGEIVEQEGLSIHKTTDGKLVYTATDLKDENNKGPVSFNTIETPRGGQYEINLPDGTKVWLNAASSLRYPIKFKGSTRMVELTGEGYFEVEKNPDMTFVVKTANQEVEVLGTHFNINGYTEEKEVKTTLLEGSVRVSLAKARDSHSKMLRPGEQSKIIGDVIKVNTVDTESVIAWKKGDFAFAGEDLKSIMRKISRWYDVDVNYRGNFDDLQFGGYIPRSKNITAVLSIMQATGKVNFKIEGKTITVLRKSKTKKTSNINQN